MKLSLTFLGSAIVLFAAGCGGGGDYYGGTKSAPNSPYHGYNTPSSVPGSYDSQSTATAGTSPPRQGGFDQSQPIPHDEADRPGLGTEWGESMTSHVHEVSFVRSGSSPFAVATMHYNDWTGVQNLANLHSERIGNRWTETPMGGGAITVSIRDESGRSLEAVKVSDRTFVIGSEGLRYSIVITNHTNHRFETVASVDGLDVINGRPGNLTNRGYVLLPFATLDIDGFRQSRDAVAAFRFSRVADSYAAQTSGDRDVGIIGVAFFDERGDSFIAPSVDQQDLHMRDTASPFPADPRFARPPR